MVTDLLFPAKHPLHAEFGELKPKVCRASQIATSWRMSNDIYNGWRSIWRITNEVVPYHRITRPGAYPDMDMLM